MTLPGVTQLRCAEPCKVSELTRAQVNEYKYEIERLTRELSDMKRRYFEQKRREQAEASKGSAAAAGKLLPAIANPSQTRYTGGGFSLATRP